MVLAQEACLLVGPGPNLSAIAMIRYNVITIHAYMYMYETAISSDALHSAINNTLHSSMEYHIHVLCQLLSEALDNRFALGPCVHELHVSLSRPCPSWHHPFHIPVLHGTIPFPSLFSMAPSLSCPCPSWHLPFSVPVLHGTFPFLSLSFLAPSISHPCPPWHLPFPIRVLHGTFPFLSLSFMAPSLSCACPSWYLSFPIPVYHGTFKLIDLSPRVASIKAINLAFIFFPFSLK